jgi:hypothetical protein
MNNVIQKSIITPYYIFHYNDPTTNTFLGFINHSSIETCSENTNGYGKWKVIGTFYGFSSTIRPIPTGLKLINANKLSEHECITDSINHVYDPFNVKKNAVSFITWTQPVPSTVPLYLHITPEKTSYPSFNKNPPVNSGGWTENKISPLYVLVNPVTHKTNVDANLRPFPLWKIDENNRPIFKFKSSSNRCIPDINGTSLQECILLTGKYDGQTDILKSIEENKNNIDNKQSIQNLFMNQNPYIIAIITFSSILSLILCIMILINNHT